MIENDFHIGTTHCQVHVSKIEQLLEVELLITTNLSIQILTSVT